MKTLTILFSFGAWMAFAEIGPSSSAAEGPFARPTEAIDGRLAARPSQASSGAGSGRDVNLSRSAKENTSLLLAVKNEHITRFVAGSASDHPNPTYLRDVLPIFIGKCFRCHNDQTKFLSNWSEYNEAMADRTEIKRRVWDSWKGGYFKQPMPTVNSPESEAITDEERALIKDWVEGGAMRGVQPAEGNPHSKAERLEMGRALFTTICAACHQPTGQGIPSRFPPLAGSDFLNANKERAIGVLLHGLQGQVVVNGQKFNNSMPLLPLNDGQIAAALTYVYSAFGNSGKDVTPEEVKTQRSRNDWLNNAPDQAKGASSPAEKSPWE